MSQKKLRLLQEISIFSSKCFLANVAELLNTVAHNYLGNNKKQKQNKQIKKKHYENRTNKKILFTHKKGLILGLGTD